MAPDYRIYSAFVCVRVRAPCTVFHPPPPLSFSLSAAGRCSRCSENVVGEGSGCTAMDQVFHVECFTCVTCSRKLRGQPFYAVEKKAYCEPCYTVSTVCSTYSRKDLTLMLRVLLVCNKRVPISCK